MSSTLSTSGLQADLATQRYIGARVGNYTIRSVLGVGGMGVVYLAEHSEIRSRAAIKVLRQSGAADADAVGRFLNEARAAAAVQHPHIVQMFDIGAFSDGAPYIVMECLEGESLSARLKRGALSIEETLAVAEQVGRALQSMHDKEIVHRDLKPHNVFLVQHKDSQQTFAKILDFGVAKLRGSQHEPWAVETAAGVILGTPRYMAPECWDGEQAGGPAADQYALAMVIWEMFAGRPVFSSRMTAALVNERMSEPPTLHKLRPDVVPAIELVLLRAMSSAPEDRFSCVAEMLEALALARAVPAYRSMRGSPALAKPRRPALEVWSALTAGIVGLTLLAMGIVDAVRGDTRWARKESGNGKPQIQSLPVIESPPLQPTATKSASVDSIKATLPVVPRTRLQRPATIPRKIGVPKTPSLNDEFTPEPL